ncbi:MAG: hypothetical protein K8F30_06360, partial [Taibaiella sp.]|nr:hypothetical protein [Taibaiella sp.]
PAWPATHRINYWYYTQLTKGTKQSLLTKYHNNFTYIYIQVALPERSAIRSLTNCKRHRQSQKLFQIFNSRFSGIILEHFSLMFD